MMAIATWGGGAFDMMAMDFVFTVLEISLVMSVAIIALMVFARVFGRNTGAAKRHFCWVIVAIGLLIPFRPSAFELPVPQNHFVSEVLEFSVFTGFGLLVEGYFGQETSGFYASNTATDSGFAGVPYAAPRYVGERAVDSRYAPTPVEGFSLSVSQILFGLWILGGLAFVTVAAVRHLKFVRGLKRYSIEVKSGAMYNLFLRVRCHVGIRRKVRLMQCPIITVPVMYGLFRPIIVVPENFHLNGGSLRCGNHALRDSESLRLMLLHEMLHIKQGHIFARGLFLVAAAVHWFNPLVHLMGRAALDESEKACDDAVIFYAGSENRENYGETLLLAARRNISPHAASVMSFALTGGGKKIKNRLVNIMVAANPKRWVLLSCTALMIIGVLSITMVSCGGSQDYEADELSQDAPRVLPPVTIIGELPGTSVAPEDRRTLTISVMDGQAIRPFVTEFRRANPDVNIEMVAFGSDFERGREQTAIQLMAGTAPTLVSGVLVDYLNPSVRRFFADWFPIMDADPTFDSSNFFTNVFDALALNGRLYGLPLTFHGSVVAYNTTIPGLSAAMAKRESITMGELMAIAQQFPENFHLERNFDVFMAYHYYSYNFFNAEVGLVNFNDQRFIDMLNLGRQLACPQKNLGWTTMHTRISRQMEAEFSQRYFFQMAGFSFMLQYFAEMEDDFLFSGTLPVVNSHGELMISGMNPFLLNTNASPEEQALAWEFMRFMLEAEDVQQSGTSAMSSVNRATMQHALEERFAGHFQGIGRLAQPANQQLPRVKARFEAIGNMPMTRMSGGPWASGHILNDVFADFHFGLITAEQAATQLQNSLTLVVMELE